MSMLAEGNNLEPDLSMAIFLKATSNDLGAKHPANRVMQYRCSETH